METEHEKSDNGLMEFVIETPRKLNFQIVDFFAKLIYKTLPKVAEKFSDDTRGGCLHITLVGSSQPAHYQIMVGKYRHKEAERYRKEARREAERLLQNPDHRLSSQSAREAHGEFGGAVRLSGREHVILSISGPPPRVCEGIGLAIGCWLERITPEQFVSVCNTDENKTTFCGIQVVISDILDSFVRGIAKSVVEVRK